MLIIILDGVETINCWGCWLHFISR